MGKEEIFHIRDEHVGSKCHFKSQTSQSYIFLQKLLGCAEFRSNLSISNVIHSRKDGQVIEDFHGNTDNPFVFATFLFFLGGISHLEKSLFAKITKWKFTFVCVFSRYIRVFRAQSENSLLKIHFFSRKNPVYYYPLVQTMHDHTQQCMIITLQTSKQQPPGIFSCWTTW